MKTSIRRRTEIARIVADAHTAASAAATRRADTVDPADALLGEVERSRGIVEHLAGLVDAVLTADDSGGFRTWSADASSPLGQLIAVYAAERRHLTRTAKAAIDAGIGTRSSVRAADLARLEDALQHVVEAAHAGASLEECRSILGRTIMASVAR